MTLREKLEQRYEIDCSNAPQVLINQNGLELKWNNDDKLYLGTDEKGVEWMAALQKTTVGVMIIPCTSIINNNNIETQCGERNMVPIFEKSHKCRKCKNTFEPQFIIPEISRAFKIFQDLDK